ncbi:hypothetical protein CHS0354_010382 [Potamilus streckersoni]|uniref:Uncharacterized protein n=1 Tax=Potamilus streckersoni TaxID=2493646 RepID=A0AAE0TDS3_9BIVA|nr:hypothetical protein CHS0354_010382 [Potamilus streckersoni]
MGSQCVSKSKGNRNRSGRMCPLEKEPCLLLPKPLKGLKVDLGREFMGAMLILLAKQNMRVRRSDDTNHIERVKLLFVN